jgi:hypothetical protein
MKAGREHRVPLSDVALRLLEGNALGQAERLHLSTAKKESAAVKHVHVDDAEAHEAW